MKRTRKWLIFCFIVILSGCVRFTERDYELQEQAYQKEREQKQQASEGTFRVQW